MERAIADEIVKVFSDFLNRGVEHRKMSRKKLVRVICQACVAFGKKDQLEFWIHADSNQRLEQWLLRQGKFTQKEALKFLTKADQVPGVIRQALSKTEKILKPLSGGKPRSLSPAETIEVRNRFRQLKQEGESSRKAWEQIASERKVSEHTIRRACDPKEAQRTRYATTAKGTALVLVGLTKTKSDEATPAVSAHVPKADKAVAREHPDADARDRIGAAEEDMNRTNGKGGIA